MADWSFEWLTAPPPMPYDPYQIAEYDPYYREKQPPPPQPLQPRQPLLVQHSPPPQAQPYLLPPLSSPTLTLLQPSQQLSSPPMMPLSMQVPPPVHYLPTLPKVDNPREIRNKAEKQRRDKLNQSIAELAALVPPVVSSMRKIDKTGVLRYTAHYLRAHQYVFEPTAKKTPEFSASSIEALLGLLNGFLLTTTYKGLVVVVSQNVKDYLGYTELELIGRSIFGIVHEEDRELLRDQLMPKTQKLGQHGELLLPDEQNARQKVAEALANEKRRFVVRFMKLRQRSEPCKYVTCHVEGSLRMSDRACRGNPCCQMVRRARARGENPCSSGNDIVFIGVVRPSVETFNNESALESYKMEYRTRHSIDGEIIECEQRIALVTGYMTNEVNGVNAMNFIHRDEVCWVIVALKEMYNQNHLFGESCYRLMMKNGEFVYMHTRGKLDVDTTSGAVTSFVCTNTVVDEIVGKYLIKQMKERFTLQVKNDDQTAIEDIKDTNDSEAVADPRKLEKVILSLVTNLPSPQATSPQMSPLRGESPTLRLSIIPPKKERILSAIEKVYSVIKTIPKRPSILNEEQATNEAKQALTPASSEASELVPLNEACYQTQNGSETEFNSETTYSPTTSSDLDYAPSCSMTRSCDEMNSLEFSNGADVDSTQPDVEIPVFSPPAFVVPTTRYQNELLLDPQVPSLKRPSRFDDRETASKKKTIEDATEQTAENDRTSGVDLPSLEKFFDEAIFNTQIAAAMDSWEDNIDPNFPDFLISQEVEDILGKIDGDQKDK